MAKRKRRRRNPQPAPEPQKRNWSLMGIGGALLLGALALIVGIARAM
ncbi:MAG: hypothetical protein U5Q44_02525 [Dehalococcoidia bacterium]|nr:hypothetical protein [Dehalococcoidia bacterium]